ncbi:MAG: B12-binding domain-containing radical SAM protein [Mucinivorans sp.]
MQLTTLLITPALTGLNTPYPATTVLLGHLKHLGHKAWQWDMSIAVAQAVFCRDFVQRMFESTELNESFSSQAINVYLAKQRYIDTIDSIWRFLRGDDHTLAQRIICDDFLPRGTRFEMYDEQELEWAFGTVATQERAKHFATLYLQELTDFIREVVDPDFDLIRYGEQIAIALPQMDALIERLKDRTIISELILTLFKAKFMATSPSIVGFSVPFPGCLLSALRCAEYLKQHSPQTTVVLGGGYINTELRQLSDSRIFDYVDYILYDDGELPLQRIVEGGELIRTAHCVDGKVIFEGMSTREKFLSQPDFTDIDPKQYISLLEMANPMHRLWSDGFWNKITAAHGCYWAKCAFCDTSLDYICRYEPLEAKMIVDNMERVMAQTGSSGFHFTDEALPPKLLREVATEILHRKLVVSYWGNIRFEKAYTQELCKLLAASGCIAVSGGLEVASNEILRQINKGVTIEQARNAMENLTSNFIMVHTYLMYGFPGQSVEQTINSLEVVRVMFSDGLIQSAFWHRFAMTVHSPVGQNPAAYGAKITGKKKNHFANNSIEFTDNQDHLKDEALGQALYKATYNYMHGMGLDTPVRQWFKLR